MKNKKKQSARKKPVAKKAKKVLVRPKKSKKPKKILKNETFSTSSFFKAKIKVIGIGGGGNSIVSEIGRSLHKATFVAADTDSRAFKKRAGIKQFLFGQEATHGLGTGLNTSLAKTAAESEKEKISKLFEHQDIVIFIACLGGGLGSGATQVFAELAKNFGGISLGIFTLPFKFEGKNKLSIAQKALRELRKSLNVSITIPNERIFKVIEADTAITDAFSIVNKSLIESLESLIDLIYGPGVINIDFADLRAILAGSGNLAFLNTAEASGPDRAQKIADQVLHNALYQNNHFNVQKVLFNVSSSGNVSMFEVDKISRAIAEQNKKAKIIFGISKDASLKNKLKTTLLMTGPAAENLKPEIRKSKSLAAPLGAKQTQKKKRVMKKIVKKVANKKPAAKKLAPKRPETPSPVSIPVFNPVSMQEPAQTIRRNALEIKEAEAQEERKKTKQEEEWEIPAFLRKIKIK